MAQVLPYGSCEQELFQKMMDRKHQSTRDRICDKVFVVGAYHSRPLTTEEQHAIFLVCGNVHSVMFFKRLYAHQQIVHCVEYKSTFRRDNSVIHFNGHGFGRVHCFVKLTTLCSSDCNEKCCGPSFYALVRVMERSAEVQDHVPRSTFHRHMVTLKPSSGQLTAINVKDITDVCVCVTVSDRLCFVSVIPNKVEKEITTLVSEKKARVLRVSADSNHQEDAEYTLSENDVNVDIETTTCDSDTQQSSVGFQETNSLEFLALVAENRELNEKVASLLNDKRDLIRKNRDLEEKVQSQSYIRCHNLKCNNKTDEFKYYTGFPARVFNVIFEFLCPVDEPFQYSSSLKNVPLKDQFLLILIKLRQNFDFKHISRLFGIPPQDCSTVFTKWINFLFYRFGSVPIWPNREVIIQNMPPKFKEEFPNTLVIIDDTELKIQRHSSLSKQSQCYSDYKSSTTLKGLVGIDPRGSIIFASMLFTGSVSDNDITIQSGFLNLLLVKSMRGME
ncbi:uncharacterized protein LOC133198236 [Saccostrea echinata]|uniref:uncharacterized protein LOC133198236 n=1 Tax=Saccostrea echinata TaxID=191078 RepID=UPI002A81C02D|nr:uncharacterized protein LOC133198236 [Saccostrea echinata]